MCLIFFVLFSSWACLSARWRACKSVKMDNLGGADLQPNQWLQNQLKVDATALYREQRLGVGYLMIFNVNVPVRYMQNQVDKRNIFSRVNNLLRREFANTNLRVQTTASYTLINRDTGATRIWSGSFWPGQHNQLAIIRDFHSFQQGSFVQECLEDSENPDDKLTWRGVDTVWVFDSLVSLIFNCQAAVAHNNRTIELRNLHPNGNTRSHVTFALD